MKRGYVYIMSNHKNGTLYVGVTNDLIRRVYEHKHAVIDGFTQKYHLKQLVYYEIFDDIQEAIQREKQLKSGNRQRKIALIESVNTHWNDLYDEIV